MRLTRPETTLAPLAYRGHRVLPTKARGSMHDTPTTEAPSAAELDAHWARVVGRRGFLLAAGAAGASLVAGGALGPAAAFAGTGRLSRGDAAILRFLAAAEILETDLWEQYEELGGVNGGNPAYMAALENLDGDMPQYISDNTDDERSHAAFLNAYLMSKGEEPVNLDEFRTLPSSKASGAKQMGRLTNLTNLTVDTSWYT